MNNGIFNQDSEIIRAIQEGGSTRERAIELLYRKHREEVLTKVKNIVRFRKGQEEDSRDLVQDAYLIMINKVCAEDYQEGSIVNFWIGIANGLFRNKRKRDFRTTLVEDDQKMDRIDQDTPESDLEQKQRQEIFNQILEKTGERCKTIMTLSFEGYSMKEIAEKMNLVSEGMARKIKYNCKKELVEMVKKLNLDI